MLRAMKPFVYIPTEVRAKVLRVDTEAGKLSLGLKPSYLEDDDDGGSDAADSEEVADEDERDLDEILAEELDAQQQQQHAAAQVCDARCLSSCTGLCGAGSNGEAYMTRLLQTAWTFISYALCIREA